MAFTSQETYDEVVKENMEEFSMTEEEAIVDAVKQFQAQGVDLSNIRTGHPDMQNSVDISAIKLLLQKLENICSKKTTDLEEIIQLLNSVQEECNKNIDIRVAFGKERAYTILLNILSQYKTEVTVQTAALKTLTALMTQQPDLLDNDGIQYMIETLDTCKNEEVQISLLKWVKECCILHEHNRQNIFDAGILDHLKPSLKDASAKMLRQILAVLRVLVLDDDIRVEFGRAHDHARTIASDTLCVITELLHKYENDETLMGDLIITLSTLIVRNEFCTKVEDAGGMDFVITAMKNFPNNEKLICQTFKLLKALAGNDTCKVHIIQKGAAPTISSALAQHKAKSQIALAALQCIASLTLRSSENSMALFDAGIAELVIECMKVHSDKANIQKSGCWAIRNMVSRNKNQCKTFLELDAEKILKENLHKFDKKCEYDAKSALRDLGCHVDLKEEWTGKGGALTNKK